MLHYTHSSATSLFSSTNKESEKRQFMLLQSAVHFTVLLFIFPVVSGKFMKQTKKCKSVYEQQNGGKYQFIS